MAPKREKTIGQKIRRLVATAVILAMTLISLLLSISQVRDGVRARRTELESTSYVYASAVAEATATKDQATIQQVFHSVQHLQDVLGIYAIDDQEKLITSMGQLTLLQNDLISSEPTIIDMLRKGSMAVSVNVVRGGVHVGRLVMIGDISNIRAGLMRTLLTTFLAAFAAVVVTLILLARMQKQITNPIVSLTRKMKNLDVSQVFQPTQIPNAEAETRELVESFNGLISELHHRDESLQKLAYFDPLTGLANRANFQRFLDATFKKGNSREPVCGAVCILTIDNFKTIHDTLGQTIGETLLVNVAKILNTVNRQCFVARIAEDEFALFLPNIENTESAQLNLAQFLAPLYAPISIIDHKIHVTLSAGVALAPIHGDDADTSRRNAYLALAQAKSDGVGRIVFFQERMAETSREDAEIETGLRQALSKNQLEVHYQPIVRADSRRVEGYEALMRWQHPEKGNIPPVKFIPVAEKSGMINELGFWILRKSCMQAKAWIDQGQPERFVSVNVSAGQLVVAEFVETVDLILRETGLPAHLLCLELTESLFAGRSMKLVQRILQELKMRGIITALDDFGTGYSTLSYLGQLPFDKLKVDRSFVHNKNLSQSHEPLLRGVINLAHALGIGVVAEGAETLAELSLLRRLGAESVQGFYFSKPLPACDVLEKTAQIESAGIKLVVDPVCSEPVSGQIP